MYVRRMRLICLLSSILLLWKKSEAADNANYNVSLGSISSTCGATTITAQSLSIDCGGTGAVCKVGDTISLNAVGKIKHVG